MHIWNVVDEVSTAGRFPKDDPHFLEQLKLMDFTGLKLEAGCRASVRGVGGSPCKDDFVPFS